MAKKYSILVENDKVIAVEIDGVRYESVDDIPDEDDRGKMFFLVESWPSGELEAAAMRRPFLLPRLIVPLFLSVAVLMLGIAVFSAINTRRALARETTAPGRVVELVVRRDSAGKDFYYPLVELSLPDGATQRVQLTTGNWPPAYEVGDPVTVAYDPSQPASARILSTSSTLGTYILTIITGILGLAFVGGTLFARWILREVPEEVPLENQDQQEG